MITFKGEWGKLYYTQHTLLSNVRQLPILFLRNKHTHEREGNEFNLRLHQKLISVLI